MNKDSVKVNETASVAPVTEQSHLSPGKCLQQARIACGMSVEQVAEALYLTKTRINALENDQYHKLPGEAFARGYLRHYARLVAASEEDIIANFNHHFAQVSEDSPNSGLPRKAKVANEEDRGLLFPASGQSEFTPQLLSKSRFKPFLWLLLIVVIVVGLVWWFNHNKESDLLAWFAPPSNSSTNLSNSQLQPTTPTVPSQQSANSTEAIQPGSPADSSTQP
jgi:cytoskeletal protein RodZ